MNVPDDRRYTNDHEWARLEGDQCTVGITKFAVDQLTDVVYLALPDASAVHATFVCAGTNLQAVSLMCIFEALEA